MPRHEIDISTGLTAAELSDVFQNNPRAYMAVRGAVAEKHLEKVIRNLKEEGEITDYNTASGDMDKDFYISYNGNILSIECKNVEVAKITTKEAIVKYLKYLEDNNHISITGLFQESGVVEQLINDMNKRDLDIIFKQVPQKYRESGISRYKYSRSQVLTPNLTELNTSEFLQQFDNNPLTIDFKRTRNSTDEDGDTRRNRFYRTDEIDIVAACVFSRTMEWKFLFAKAQNFSIHEEYADRYSDKLSLRSDIWVSDIKELFQTYQ